MGGAGPWHGLPSLVVRTRARAGRVAAAKLLPWRDPLIPHPAPREPRVTQGRTLAADGCDRAWPRGARWRQADGRAQIGMPVGRALSPLRRARASLLVGRCQLAVTSDGDRRHRCARRGGTWCRRIVRREVEEGRCVRVAKSSSVASRRIAAAAAGRARPRRGRHLVIISVVAGCQDTHSPGLETVVRHLHWGP